MSENTTTDVEYQTEMFNKSFEILSQFETADEIAAFLEAQGIKATRCNAESCAISEYVKSNING